MKKFFSAFLLIVVVLVASGCDKSDILAGSNVNVPFVPNGTVYFEANGGTRISSVATSLLETAPTPTKENCLFDGWYRDEGLTVAAVFPLEVAADTTLYAKWLKLYDERGFQGCKIKFMDSAYSSGYIYQVSPPEFDLARLAELGYKVEITVNYSVRYKKDYDVLWDIGYAGAPKYEVYLLNSESIGTVQENKSTPSNYVERSITLTSNAVNLIGEKITFRVSTDNIQNIIYFSDIMVTYRCYK